MTSASVICIRSATSVNSRKAQAMALAKKLAVPYVEDECNSFKYNLVYTDNHLEVQQNHRPGKYKLLPISVNFLHNDGIHKRISTTTVKNPLARAIGIKPSYRPTIADATAGMGVDGVSLAYLGCKITLIERSPIIHALLQDGLARAAENTSFSSLINKNIILIHGDSTEVLPHFSVQPESVLVDPMYPHSGRTALNKKEMRVFRDIVGDDVDSKALFSAALSAASKRVVVKRPKGAEPICRSPRPSHRIEMKSGRYDVYLTSHL